MWLWGGVSDLLYACSIEQICLTILVAAYFSVYQFDVDVVLGQLCTIGSMCDRRSIVTTTSSSSSPGSTSHNHHDITGICLCANPAEFLTVALCYAAEQPRADSVPSLERPQGHYAAPKGRTPFQPHLDYFDL